MMIALLYILPLKKKAIGNRKALSKTRFKMERELRLIMELQLKGYGTDEIKPMFNVYSCLNSEY